MREQVITQDRIEALAQEFDGYWDFKELVKGIAGIGLELADKTIFLVTLNLLNRKLFVKMPEELDNKANAFVDEILNEDYDVAADLLGDITAGLVDTSLGDEAENAIADTIFTILASFIEGNGGDTYKVRANIQKRQVEKIKRSKK